MIENKRLHYLHAIRGWAALFVVIAHAKYPFWSGGKAYIKKFPVSNWNIWDYALFSIDMSSSFASVFVITFFVLSGYFIARSIKKKKYSPLFFYGDRIIRIYIPYIGSLILGFLSLKLAYMINPELFHLSNPTRPYNKDIIKALHSLNWDSLYNSIFFLPGKNDLYFGYDYSYWSLRFELIFYIIIPFVFIFLKRYWFFAISVVLFIMSFFIGHGNWLSIRAFFLNYSIYFATGVFLYELSNDKINREKLINFTQKHITTLIIISFLFIIISKPLGITHHDKIGYLFGLIATFSLMLWLLFGKENRIYNILKNFLINKFSLFLGKISYSIYLIHVPVLLFMYAVWTKITGKIIFYEHIYWIVVLLMIPIGYIFYLIFEKTSLILLSKYKEKFSKHS